MSKTKTMPVPLDPRSDKQVPMITNTMKAYCHGEHSFTISEPCPKCALELGEKFDDVECLCDGSDDECYEREIMVPWNTCKEIYQQMATMANGSPELTE